MSLVSRIGGALQRRRDRFRYEVLRPQASVSDIYAALAPGLDVDLSAPDGFARLWAAHAVATPSTLWSVMAAVTREIVDETRRGDARILTRTLCITPETDWHREPFHGTPWPRVHVDSCPYVIPGADIGVLWQLNRMEYLAAHATAYRTTLDERFAGNVTGLLDSWTRANPWMVGANWISPMESGIRLFHWSIALAGIAAAPVPPNDVCERILRSVVRQAEFLSSHFSTWPVPNNHLIGEAATLAALAVYWPELRASREWMAHADATLAEEARRQILKNGFQFENSVNYHFVTLDFFLVYLHAKLLRGENPPALVLEKTRAMIEVALTLTAPSGRIPMIGDDSMPRLMVLGGTMGSPGPLSHDAVFEDFLRLEHTRLFSTTVWGRDLLALRRPLVHTRRFEDAGIDVSRDRNSHIVFTHGPQHRRPFSHGHLHADAGSFELELDGDAVIIDSGTYLYGADARLRRHMRGARAHNTVIVDGMEPMKALATFQWESIAAGEALGFGALDDVMATGCRRLIPGAQGTGVEHTRALVRVAATVLVIDRIKPVMGVTTPSHDIECYFHTPIAPGVACVEGRQVRLTDSTRFVRIFEALEPPAAQLDLVGESDLAALYSPAYGEKANGTTIRVRVPVREPVVVVCALRSPEVAVTRAQSREGHIAFSIDNGHVRRLVNVRFDPFGVFVGGRAIVGATPRPSSRAPGTAPVSLAWLDEIDA